MEPLEDVGIVFRAHRELIDVGIYAEHTIIYNTHQLEIQCEHGETVALLIFYKGIIEYQRMGQPYSILVYTDHPGSDRVLRKLMRKYIPNHANN